MANVVQVLVRERLESSGADPRTGAAVLAAFDGPDRLAAVLAEGGKFGTAAADAETAEAGQAGTAAGRAWLTGIRVEGFRGVAQALELSLTPGPGLVLVTGRNGSGKSSLAEAAELALSGTSDRATTRLWARGL